MSARPCAAAPPRRRRRAALVAGLCAVVACGPEPAEPSGESGEPDEPVTERACPVIARTRLVAAPDEFAPELDAYYSLYVFGDDPLFSFDARDDRCTGDAGHARSVHHRQAARLPRGVPC
ncbi:hypothetical protein [Nannocystis pusilla]|uniref:Lipoprotein n=1 Tax=Nannocystis pusilla TaxID=889268 RepID=A0ABS7TR04_9BACT|nr:hypothetical protein [Nannocystis pusilla]MBZ5710658.1 hypothetical protein [Nannocystis pusilla]